MPLGTLPHAFLAIFQRTGSVGDMIPACYAEYLGSNLLISQF